MSAATVVLLVALAVAFGASPNGVRPAAALTRGQLPSAGMARSSPAIDPSTVVQLSDPGVELTAPVDGRLRGDAIALVVTGAALADRAGTGGQTVSAGSGRHLLVFGLRQVPQPAGESGPPAALAVVVDGFRRPVNLPAASNGVVTYFAAAVPAGTTVADLELTAAGFSQDFNLMSLSRTGLQPAVLYRDPDNADADTVVDASVNVGATVPLDPGETYTDTITVGTVTLSYFAPIPAADPAPALDEAYLEINATEKPVVDVYGGHDVHFSQPVPAGLVHLVLPGAAAVAATQTGCTCDDPDNTDYVVATTYYFVVPAAVTTATWTVAPYEGDGFEYINETGSHQQVSLAGFSVPLSLNPPAPAAATSPVTLLQLTHSTLPAATAGSGVGHGTHLAPLWIVLILLVGAAAVVVTAVRRRRGSAPPTALPRSFGSPSASPAPPQPVRLEVPADRSANWSPPVARGPSTGPSAPPAPAAYPIVSEDLRPSEPGPDLLNNEGADAAENQRLAPTHDHTGPPGLPPRDPAAQAVSRRQDAFSVPAPPLEPANGRGKAESTLASAVAGVESRSAAVSVGVLGPLQLRGPGTAKFRPRDQEVFLFLAVNRDRPVTNDDIRAAVAGAVDDESNANTVRTWLSRLRTTVGAEVLPEADYGRYRLADVDVDIARFEQLTAQAAAVGDLLESVRLLRAALELVRGRPFEGLDYRWTPTVAARLETALANAANRLADLSCDSEPDVAVWAAQRGLSALVQPDDRLLAHLLRAGAASGPGLLGQAWREVIARYAAVGDAPGPDLVALYDQLRSGQLRH